MSDETYSVEEIREWEEENDGVHPAFRVEHRPQRTRVMRTGPKTVRWSLLTPCVHRRHDLTDFVTEIGEK